MATAPVGATRAPNKITNVRTIALQTLPHALSALRWLSPSLAERKAAELFFVPRRTHGSASSPLPDVPLERVPFAEGSLAVAASGDEPRVLLVHGWNGHGGQLRHVAASLRAEGFGVVSFDMPGHGRSGGRTTDVVHMASALELVSRAHGPFYGVVAHSLGATATAYALSRSLHVPHAVLLAPAAEPSLFAQRLCDALRLPADASERVKRHIEWRLGGSFEALDLRRLVGNLRTRALVVHDVHDRDVPFEHGRSIAAAWPGARFRAAQGLGHHRVLRDENLLREVTAFLLEGSVPPRALAPLELVVNRT